MPLSRLPTVPLSTCTIHVIWIATTWPAIPKSPRRAGQSVVAIYCLAAKTRPKKSGRRQVSASLKTAERFVPRCQICLRSYRKVRFKTEEISICGTCVNTLNDAHEPAAGAYQELAAKLERGITRRVAEDLASEEAWRRHQGERDQGRVPLIVQQRLDDWNNRLLADPANTGLEFKQARAHRRGLLRLERPVGGWDYPPDWRQRSGRIWKRDKKKCVDCGSAVAPLDVHHIVYLSNFGTSRQENLVTLCRACHENLHGRAFDPAEAGMDCGESSHLGTVIAGLPTPPPPQPAASSPLAIPPSPIAPQSRPQSFDGPTRSPRHPSPSPATPTSSSLEHRQNYRPEDSLRDGFFRVHVVPYASTALLFAGIFGTAKLLTQSVPLPTKRPVSIAQAQPATTTIETVAATVAREHNQVAPSMLGDNLLATSAVAVGRNVRLTYVVRTRRGLTQQQRSEFVAATKADVMPRACQVNAGNPAFERGLYYTFIYDNSRGERLTSFDVDRQLCAGR